MNRTHRIEATSLLKLDKETPFWHNDIRLIRNPRLLTITASVAFGPISLDIRVFGKDGGKLAAVSEQEVGSPAAKIGFESWDLSSVYPRPFSKSSKENSHK